MGQPEFRLPLAVVGALALPALAVFYGCVTQLFLPLPVPLLSVVLLGAAVMLSVLPMYAYAIDAFGCYSASAMTGLIFVRSLRGTFLPLAAKPLTDRFGSAGRFAMLGAVCICLAPVPILVMRYSQVWRQGSKHSRD